MTTTAHLEPRLVGDLDGSFFIPAYQRGYRWGELEVTQLLDDIHRKGNEPYYLQPVVVRATEQGEWELIDGQQRLTTLFLILTYMNASGLKGVPPGYAIRYDTRPDSEAYLHDPDPAKAHGNLDFFHISKAYAVIGDWFDAHGNRRQLVADEIYGALFKTVRVIWYEVAADVDAVELFTRLNVGRIPLTDAELIKALLLSGTTGHDGTTGRSLEIAAHWDVIERDLRRSDVWAFLTGDARAQATHIGLLFQTLAGLDAEAASVPFSTFLALRDRITEHPIDFWHDVTDLHSQILGWFEDRSIHHKIGYLTLRRTSFRTIRDLAAEKGRSAFEAALDAAIRDDLAVTEVGLRGLTYGDTKTPRALLLMNVETVRRYDSTARYPFHDHAVNSWSLEHIHAQSAQQLNRVEQWREWMDSHREAVAGLPADVKGNRDGLLATIDGLLGDDDFTGEDFEKVEQEVTAMLSDAKQKYDLDSIGNLALLDGGTNSALSNAVFAVKRRRVLDLDRDGAHIPVCTRNVFLKHHAPPNDPQLHFWSQDDHDAYVNEMVEVLQPYLVDTDGGKG